VNQEKALAILKSGKNVFLTGSAGTGKTYVLNTYIRYLRSRRIPVSVTASTGIAATHLEGTTIHAWSGIGIRDKLSPRQLSDLKTKKYLKKHMEKTRVLIIDEISMLHARQLDLVNQVIRSFKESEEPFGGIQLVLCGDFFQLPPIGGTHESSRDKFSFMSRSWLEADLCICYLTEQFRQSDSQFTDLLNEIRSGTVSTAAIELLNSRKNPDSDENPSSQAVKVSDAEKDLTRLYTHNLDVDRVNQDHLNKLSGRVRTFDAKIKGNLKLAETIQKSIMAPPVLQLKKGACVMFVKNNYEKGYLNGSMGKILNFDKEGLPLVRLVNGSELKAEPEEWRIEDETGKLLVSYNQVPLRLAWAITVHKSQGMTLDSALMDLGRTFERGQGYVALSRVKSLDGLKLLDFNHTTLQVDSLALRADQRFQELSQESEERYDEKELSEQARDFVKHCGGISDPEEIRSNREQLEKGKTVKKRSTYLITKRLIEQGHSLEEISIQRDLTLSTLCTHLLKISSMYPDTDLSRFKPDRSTMAKVRNARKKLLKSTKQGETVSLKPLFDALKGDLSYDQIKVALLFV
jgi:ATP-dependent exoDNAse (exonuclease V) alpha subunit